MKPILILLFLFTVEGIGQEWYKDYNGSITLFGVNMDRNIIVTDSRTWTLEAVQSVGDTLCQHDFVEGEFTTANPGVGCLVYHNGFHCSYQDAVKSKICRKCLRKERWREVWRQHIESPPKTEYDILDDSLKAKKP